MSTTITEAKQALLDGIVRAASRVGGEKDSPQTGGGGEAHSLAGAYQALSATESASG